MVTLALTLVGCKPEPLDPSLYPGPDYELSLFDPAPGAMISQGDRTLHGEVKGLTDVTVNGDPVQVDGNLWTADVTVPRGITTFEVSGLDQTGHRKFLRQSVLAGEFGGFDATVDQGVGIRVNQGGLDAAGDLVAGLVDPVEIANLLPSLNPVYQDSYGVFGLDAVDITADLQSLWFDPPQIILRPGAGEVEILVTLPNLSVVVPTYGQVVGVDFDEDLTLTADAAVIHGYLELGAKNGALTADLVDPTVNLQGFTFDTSLLPGPVEDWLLGDTVQAQIEDLLVTQISTMVPSLLDDQLSALSIAFSTDLMGKTLDLSASFDTVSIDQDGILLETDVDLGVEGAAPKDSQGWLTSGEGKKPRPSTGPDLAIQLADDVVNKLLHDLWRSGMMDLKLSTDDGSLDPLMLIPLGASAQGGSISTVAKLPPVLIQDGQDAVLQFGEMEVTLDTPGGDNGNHLVAVAAGQVPLDLELVDQNLTMKLGDPVLTLMVRDSDWGATDETVTDLLTSQLPVATLLALVGDIEIPMPSLAGITLPDASIDRDDGGLSTTVHFNL
jgi:hypothetical protein